MGRLCLYLWPLGTWPHPPPSLRLVAQQCPRPIVWAQAADPDFDEDAYTKERMQTIERGVKRQNAAAFAAWGQHFFVGNDNIAPLRGALAVWGLTADDIGVASFHGTSTQANDLNESEVVNLQMRHLGRSRGTGPSVLFRPRLLSVVVLAQACTTLKDCTRRGGGASPLWGDSKPCQPLCVHPNRSPIDLHPPGIAINRFFQRR